MPDPWDPDQYHQFAAERMQPFIDLLSMIERRSIARAVDLGCGSGELTRRAADELCISRMLGIDSSPTMLGGAAQYANESVEFVTGDIEWWSPDGGVDLVVASASLHWLPNHAAVLDRWSKGLAPGGQLAVQVPANADAITHRIAEAVAEQEPFLSAFGPGGPPPDPVRVNVQTPEEYSRMLYTFGFERQQVQLRVYPHVLASVHSAVQWLNGTTLTRFRSRLTPEMYALYLEAYESALTAELGDQRPYFFPFRRILMAGAMAY